MPEASPEARAIARILAESRAPRLRPRVAELMKIVRANPELTTWATHGFPPFDGEILHRGMMHSGSRVKLVDGVVYRTRTAEEVGYPCWGTLAGWCEVPGTEWLRQAGTGSNLLRSLQRPRGEK